MKLGVYIHIPFCRKKCGYCNFYSVPINIISGAETSKDDILNRGSRNFPDIITTSAENKNDLTVFDKNIVKVYIERLLLEIEQRSNDLSEYSVDTIYFGGGTPSIIAPNMIKLIIDKIKNSYSVNENDIETTIECNPEDFNPQRINEYREAGVNRVVLGVQTINLRSHRTLGRSSILCGRELLESFRDMNGIIHCIDLMIGIPGQSIDDLYEELEIITSLRFEHISMYTLSIEEGTPLAERLYRAAPFDESQRTLLERANYYLKKRGYIHYEVSNYTLPFFEAKHNSKYWSYLPYIGFGAGAHSFYHGERYFNPDSVEIYLKTDIDFRVEDIRSHNSEIVEYILTGMRRVKGISVNDFEKKLKIPFPQDLMNKIIRLSDRRDLLIGKKNSDTIIRFTESGFYFLDRIIFEMTEMYL